MLSSQLEKKLATRSGRTLSQKSARMLTRFNAPFLKLNAF
jgi:hypothetical protein